MSTLLVYMFFAAFGAFGGCLFAGARIADLEEENIELRNALAAHFDDGH